MNAAPASTAFLASSTDITVPAPTSWAPPADDFDRAQHADSIERHFDRLHPAGCYRCGDRRQPGRVDLAGNRDHAGCRDGLGQLQAPHGAASVTPHPPSTSMT